LPRRCASQAGRKWDRFPAKTLRDKRSAIFGFGVIARRFAPLCKASGDRGRDLVHTAQVAGFDRMHGPMSFPRR